jgi:hypothetical protein
MNNGLNDVWDIIVDSSAEFWQSVAEYLPKLLGAAALIILGALVAKLAASLTKKVLEFVGVDKLTKNKTVKETLSQVNLKINFVNAAASVVFWVVIVIFAMTAADVLELAAMRDVIRELLAYLPNVLAAVIVLTVTVAGARLLKDALVNVLERVNFSYASTIAAVAQGVIFTFGLVFALAQLGFDTTILTANITLIVAGVVTAVALAFGLGGRSMAANFLASHHARRLVKKGQRVSVGDVTGTVKQVNSVAVVVETANGDVVVPFGKLLG